MLALYIVFILYYYIAINIFLYASVVYRIYIIYIVLLFVVC